MQSIRTNPDYLRLDDPALLAQCRVDLFRAQGPGGQKRNKTSSAVRIVHEPTGLMVTATEDRSQHVNRKRALRRIRDAIALFVRTGIDPESYEPSEILRPYIDRKGRLGINRKNDEYCRVVQEVLNVFATCEAQAGEAAKLLGITTSQLVAFAKSDTRVWGRINQMRADTGRKALK